MGTDPSSSGRPDCSSPRPAQQTSALDSGGRRTRSREASSQETGQDYKEDVDAVSASSQPLSKKMKLESVENVRPSSLSLLDKNFWVGLLG